MESNSPFRYPRKPVPTSPISPISSNIETPSPVISHKYAQIPFNLDSENHDDPMVSLITSRQTSTSLEDIDQPSPKRNLAAVEADIDHEEVQKTEQYEIGVHSMDLDEPNEQFLRQPHYWRVQKIVAQFWLFETAACIFSSMSLAVIIGVLIYEDGKQLDQWKWSVTPTAVVSFIGTLAKASLVLVLSQLLSQLKWLHFQQTNSLRDMRIFDWSSRGPLGSMLVLWNSKRILVSIAACLMVLTILVDPFLQLVFSFPAEIVEDESQQTLFLRMNDWGGEPGPKYFLPSERIWASINQGLTAENINTTLICPSGNCVWPQPIKTLGICGSCSDVTASVQRDCSIFSDDITLENGLISRCNYTWNNDSNPVELQAGLWLYSDSNYDTSSFRTMWNSTAAYSPTFITNHSAIFIQNHTVVELDGHAVNLFVVGDYDGNTVITSGDILDFNAIQLPPVEDGSYNYTTEIPQAKCWECEMHWCEKKFENLRITNGGPPEYSISEQRLWFIQPYADMETPDSADFDYEFDLLLGAEPSEFDHLEDKVWNFSYRINDSMIAIQDAFFNGYYVDGSVSSLGYSWPSDSMSPQTDLANNPGAIIGLAFSNDINATINKLADSMTEAIRTGPNAIGVQGNTLVSRTFIHVRWTWLALPLTLMIITCVLLPIIAIQSHRKQVAIWKDDPLALLFHRINGLEVVPGSNSRTGPSDLNNLADEVYVKLDQDVPFAFVRTVDSGQNRHKRKQVRSVARSQ